LEPRVAYFGHYRCPGLSISGLFWICEWRRFSYSAIGWLA